MKAVELWTVSCNTIWITFCVLKELKHFFVSEKNIEIPERIMFRKRHLRRISRCQTNKLNETDKQHRV
jgi:hypothetical protein